MKRITLGFFLLFTQFIFAQFTANDVKFFVGSGTETAYMVVDFRDGTDDTSYAWGYRFDASDRPSMEQMLLDIAAAEPNLTVRSSGYLYDITFNSHGGIDSQPDWWSIWSGGGINSTNLTMSGGGIGTAAVADGLWYGVSYGFNPAPLHPATPIAAYSSLWYSSSDIITWLGTGAKESLVVIDFGTETNGVEDSYVFGILYDGTLTAADALDLIETEVGSGFSYTMNAADLSSVTIGSRTETASGTDVWSYYTGTDLSNWETETDFSLISLDDTDWLGLSLGERRPFTPQDITAALSSKKHQTIDFSVYPNPASDILNIQTNEEIKEVAIYNMQGRKLIQGTTSVLNVSSLSSGMYLLELHTANGKASVKFVKQ